MPFFLHIAFIPELLLIHTQSKAVVLLDPN
jgi:hypothetical protein